MPAAFPMVLPPVDESRLSALCRKVCPALGDPGGVGLGDSNFLASLVAEEAATLEELLCSPWALFGDFAGVSASVFGLGDDAFELENFELKVVTHELLRPVGAGLGSF